LTGFGKSIASRWRETSVCWRGVLAETAGEVANLPRDLRKKLLNLRLAVAGTGFAANWVAAALLADGGLC